MLLDSDLENRATEIESQFKNGNAIDLGGMHTPHVTLYHSKLKNVPQAAVKDLLQTIAEKLPSEVAFTQVAPFGGKFLFWDMEKSTELLTSHGEALRLSSYFEPVGEQQADKEGISLSPQEDENVRVYGHPLVNELWRPHITLGYYPEGAPDVAKAENITGKVAGVAFVRVGEAGTIAEIIATQEISQR